MGFPNAQVRAGQALMTTGACRATAFDPAQLTTPGGFVTAGSCYSADGVTGLVRIASATSLSGCASTVARE